MMQEKFITAFSYMSMFPEYFIVTCSIYILIAMTLITYNVYGLMIQKALSECISLLLFMTCYLMTFEILDPIQDNVIEAAEVIGYLPDEFRHIYNPIFILVQHKWMCVGNNTVASFGESFIVDHLYYISRFIVCFSASIYFYIISNFLKYQKLIAFEYLLITLFAVLGLILMCNSYDLLSAYLAIELSSLAFYILAAFKKTSNYSVESGLKYFVTGAVSSAFFLLGCSIIYGLTGSINFSEFKHAFDTIKFHPPLVEWITAIVGIDIPVFTKNLPIALSVWHEEAILSYVIPTGNRLTELGMALVFFSLFIKLGLAPFHLWTLDVYEGSPTSSTFFFAVISKFSIFILLIRLGHYQSTFKELWIEYSITVATLSIFVGCFGGLKTRKLKTLLAYSSISHMGFALLAFSSLIKLVRVEMLFFYLLIYILSGLTVWFIILALRLKRKTSKDKISKELGDLALLSKSNPALAFSFTLTMFSLAGIPPMIGFLSKLGVFVAVLDETLLVFAIISIFCTVISTFYYIRIIKVLYFENILVGKLYYPLNNQNVLLLSLLIFFLVFLFINPTPLYLCIKLKLECVYYYPLISDEWMAQITWRGIY